MVVVVVDVVVDFQKDQSIIQDLWTAVMHLQAGDVAGEASVLTMSSPSLTAVNTPAEPRRVRSMENLDAGALPQADTTVSA